MKIKHFVFVCFIIGVLMCSPILVYGSDDPLNTSLVATHDRTARRNIGVDSNWVDGDYVFAYSDGANLIYRGYFRWNLSSIPDTAVVTRIEFHYQGQAQAGTKALTNFQVDPNTLPISLDMWNAIASSPEILTIATFPEIGANKNQLLGTNTSILCANLTTQIQAGENWFGLGYKHDNEAVVGGNSTILNIENGAATPKPTLYIEYYADPAVYSFTDTYYENGTLCVPPVNVSISGNGFTDEFNTSGGTNQYFDVEPELFYWDLGGGYSRPMYSIGSENITITVPEATFYAYAFTIKDYTGKLGAGDAFLEAERPINGTYTIIERNKILSPNACPLNLVYGVTYKLYVRFSDGTRYYWGEFTALLDQTTTIITRSVSFTDQVQVLFGDIHVEASRGSGVITVDYLDDLNLTVWANVTIRIRNGAIVNTESRNNESYTYNWASADTNLGYVVTITGEHQKYGDWGSSFILDAAGDFPDGPSLNGIYGDLSDDFIPWILVVLTLMSFFGRRLYAMGGIAGMFMASALSYIGWASWGPEILFFGWLIALGSGIKMYMEGQG